MTSSNATELYISMHSAIVSERWERQVDDPESPQTAATFEARPGQEFELRFPAYNVQVCVPFDVQWAIANALHFFATTEEAEMLEKYNRHANRFTVDGKWVGAYGAIAMPQVRECVARLKSHPASRRAVVSMGEMLPQDINRPACWSFLQFLKCRHGLCMLVYQRSLNLTKVMPYDLVVLSNLLLHVAEEVNQEPSSLIWTIGSLHSLNLAPPNHVGHRHNSLLVETNPTTCLAALRNPGQYKETWKCINCK